MLAMTLKSLRHELAQAAQTVLNTWNQDEAGFDEILGFGGPCDEIAAAMSSVIAANIPDAEIRDGGFEGDDHAWVIVQLAGEACAVDVPPDVYEIGGGYAWRKRENAVIQVEDVVIEPTEFEDTDD